MTPAPPEPKIKLAELSIVDRVCREKRDMLWLLMVSSGQFTLLPELYDIIGANKLVRFLEIFGGTRIDVPPREAIIDSARAVDIFARMTSAPHQRDMVERLAEEYEISEAEVQTIYQSTADRLHGFADIKLMVEPTETPEDVL